MFWQPGSTSLQFAPPSPDSQTSFLSTAGSRHVECPARPRICICLGDVSPTVRSFARRLCSRARPPIRKRLPLCSASWWNRRGENQPRYMPWISLSPFLPIHARRGIGVNHFRDSQSMPAVTCDGYLSNVLPSLHVWSGSWHWMNSSYVSPESGTRPGARCSHRSRDQSFGILWSYLVRSIMSYMPSHVRGLARSRHTSFRNPCDGLPASCCFRRFAFVKVALKSSPPTR